MIKMVKKVLGLILVISIVFNIPSPVTFAVPKNQSSKSVTKNRSKRIEQLRREINSNRQKIESNKNNKKQLEIAKNEMTKSLSQVSKNVEELEQKYKENLKLQDERMERVKVLDEQIGKNQSKINELNNQINQIKANSDKLQNRILQCLKWTYKHVRKNFVEIFFSAKSYSDITRMTKYMEVYCKYEKKLIVDYTSEINKINAIKNAKQKEQDQINSYKNSVNKEVELINKNANEINRIQNEKNNLLGILHKNIKNIDNKTEEIKTTEKMLNDKIAKLKQELEDCSKIIEENTQKFSHEIKNLEKKASKNTSSKGNCFPVASPCHVSRGYSRGHRGMDIATNSRANPIYSMQDGVVISAGFGVAGSGFGGYGNYAVIAHAGGISTLYGHMSRLCVKRGQHVSKGEVIGYVGSTGKSTGMHCHFEVRNSKGGTINPASYVSR